MAQAWEVLVNATVLGSVYALVALGLTLLYGTLRILNFAHGEFFMVGAFGGLVVNQVTGSFALALVSATVAGALIAVLSDRVVFRPIRDAEPLMSLASSFGLSLVLMSLALLMFGPDARAYPDVPSGSVNVGFPLATSRLLIVVVALVMIAALLAFERYSTTGKTIRAVAQGGKTAELMGINSESVFTTTFLVAGAMAGLAGGLLAPLLLVSPGMGLSVVVKAFAIVIVGGFGNVNGTIVAALVIGLSESVTAAYLLPQWVDAVTFGLLVVVIVLRPTGILRERVAVNI